MAKLYPKQHQIDEWNERPIQIGDHVRIRIPYRKATNPTKRKVVMVDAIKEGYGKVLSITQKGYKIDTECGIPYEVDSDRNHFKPEWVLRDFSKCGTDPFKSKPPKINFYSTTIDALLQKCGYGRDGSYENIVFTPSKIKGEQSYGGVNFDPTVMDSDGNIQHFQRGYVWTTEQKQDLIQSIFNWIEIGKFVLKYNSWKSIESQMEARGHGYDFDCVDGKQRLDALIGFVQNKFPTSDGLFWNEMSNNAQREFMGYDTFALGVMPEETTDSQVLQTFLTLNFTGVPISREHIEFVQSIKM